MFGRQLLLHFLKAAGMQAKRRRFRRAHLLLTAWLVRRTGLFDESWYARRNPDVVAAGHDLLTHFIQYGDIEGRSPLPLFEPGHYRAYVSPRCPKVVNSLLHYAWLGRYVGAATSPWFDSGFYLAGNRDVKFSRMDPLLHFVRSGWHEGRAPTPDFNRQQFLRALPDFDESAAALLVDLDVPHAVPPSDDEWMSLVPARHDGPCQVDVIVPVYRGYNETLRCIYAALKYSQRVPFELIVIHDAGPDPDLAEKLATLAGHGLFTYIENESNLGFVRTVNNGMRLHPNRDVVLLNADAEPYNDWLDRLRDTAYAKDRVATVTPLSNNATICSYPHFVRDNPFSLEISGAELDRLTARVNAGYSVAAPTGVGFCMYIRRAAIDAIGLFDEEAFGHGYGEENDFCQRAIAAGWQNLLAADVYVWHWGSTSFGGTRHARVHAALEVIARRFPKYHGDVEKFIAADPLAEARRRLDRARIRRMGGRENVLVVTHNRGGGTDNFVKRVVADLRAAGRGVFSLRPTVDSRAVLSAPGVTALPNMSSIDITSGVALGEALAEFDIHEIQIHQLVDFADGATVAFRAAVAAARKPITLKTYVHDYYPICPRINLVDETGTYCGEPREGDCNRCLQRPPRLPGERATDILRWRTSMRALYESADAVIVPDEDVSNRLRRYFPQARFAVEPHEPGLDCLPAAGQSVVGEMLEIVVIGAIGNIKGYEVIAACARDARQRSLPIRFTVMGYTRDDHAMRALGVNVTGRYREEDALATLAALNPSLVWLPSVWPETYSYTLSIALASGYTVAGFDLGAIAGRLRRGGHAALLMPPDWAKTPQRINDGFLEWVSDKAGAVSPRT